VRDRGFIGAASADAVPTAIVSRDALARVHGLLRAGSRPVPDGIAPLRRARPARVRRARRQENPK
jgi:hypothetical protein